MNRDKRMIPKCSFEEFKNSEITKEFKMFGDADP